MQGSDEESDVDDEEREVEAYDRKLADAEWVATPNSALVLCCKLLCVVGTTEFKRAERKERRSLRRWKGACCSSHVTRHTLHVTRYTLHVTRYTLHVIRYTLHVTCYTLHVTCHRRSPQHGRSLQLQVHPKPQTTNPKPQTPKPTPDTAAAQSRSP